MSVSSDVRNDIKAARKIWLPWRVLLAWAALCLPVIIICDRLGKLNMSLPILNCIGVFGFLIYLKWELRRQAWFWMTMGVLAVLHAALIWYLPWTSKWVPAVAIAVISSADFCLMLWILAAVGRLMEASTTAQD